jgi:hypothetical protein
VADYKSGIPHVSFGGLMLAEFRQYHEPETSDLAWH